MVRVRKLIEQRATLHPVCVMQLGDVGRQGFRVAGDVQDAFETTGQLAGVRVHPCARRVDEHAAEVEALQVHARQTPERAHIVQRFGQLFGRQPNQRHVIHRVVCQVAQGGVDRGLADLGRQHLAHACRQRQR
nr:hypothetical protein [Tanacetum cinerariifolium]